VIGMTDDRFLVAIERPISNCRSMRCVFGLAAILWLSFALATVVGPPCEADAATSGTRLSIASSRPPVKRITSGNQSRAKRDSTSKRKRREVSRVPNRRTSTNMPRGWSWPPSKAMRAAGQRCTSALDSAGIDWRPARREGKIVTPVTLGTLQMGGIEYHAVFRRPPFTMDCHLALALVTHSPLLYDLGVRKVNFGSIFRFTKVRAFGKTKNVLSRHALGLAMDVVSFEDSNGEVVNVERDYRDGNELLLGVEDTLNSSGGFRTVLTPRNDPKSHHDHFHIEAAISYYDDERNLATLRAPGSGGGEAELPDVPDVPNARDRAAETTDQYDLSAPIPGGQQAP
jgi:hypothetical protein